MGRSPLGNADSAGSDGTLTQAIEEFGRRGYVESFRVVDGALWAAGRGQPLRPRDLVIREYRRFEGVSDPDDMAIVYAIESHDGVRGTLTDAFGVYSDPAVSGVLQDVRIVRVLEEERGRAKGRSE